MTYLELLTWAKMGIRTEIAQADRMHTAAMNARDDAALAIAQKYIDDLEGKLDIIEALEEIHNRT